MGADTIECLWPGRDITPCMNPGAQGNWRTAQVERLGRRSKWQRRKSVINNGRKLFQGRGSFQQCWALQVYLKQRLRVNCIFKKQYRHHWHPSEHFYKNTMNRTLISWYWEIERKELSSGCPQKVLQRIEKYGNHIGECGPKQSF